MSVLLKKILWYRVSDPDTPINLTNTIDFNMNRGVDIRNNVLILNLKNPPERYDSDTNEEYPYIDLKGDILFDEKDQIKVYLLYSDDFSEIEADAWDSTKNDEPSNDYLKGVYYVIEYNSKSSEKGSHIRVRCADKTYILFSKLWAFSYKESDNLNAPEIIQKVVRHASNSPKGAYSGTGDDAGALYDIDARLVSEGGQIQDTRKNTTEKGTVNSDTTFPDIAIAKIWKPIYDWVSELSQIENINTSDEINGTNGKTIVYGRPFFYYVDELNVFHWVETDNTVDETITIGTTTGIYDYNLDKAVFDTVNFIIFRGGEDFYGNGTIDYEFQANTNVKTRKMRVVAMTDIAKTLIQAEINKGNLVSNTSGSYTFSGNRYNRNGTVTPDWTSTSYSTDDSYNTALRTEILRLGKQRARALISKLAYARYRGTIERKGYVESPGTLLKITNPYTGQKNELIRVVGVSDVITKRGWFTTLQLEQDQEAIVEALSA